MNGAGVSQVRQVADRPFAPGDPQLGVVDLVVRALQEPLEHPELVEDLHGRGVYRVAAEIAEEVGVLLEHQTLQPARANSSPAIIPAGPPPTTIRSFMASPCDVMPSR